MLRRVTLGAATAARGVATSSQKWSYAALTAVAQLESVRPADVHIRVFHSSVSALAKASNKGGKGKKGGDDDDTPAVELPKVKPYETSMENTFKWFQSEIAKIKVGAVSVEMFSNLPLQGSSFGTVGRAGQVVMKTSTKLTVALFDPAAAGAVVEALKNSGLNMNPSVEGSNVNATIPRPSKESRDLMVANASRLAEKAKLDIRSHRKKGGDDAKKAKSSNSEDDFRRFTKELDAATEKKVEAVSTAFKAKEKELLAGV